MDQGYKGRSFGSYRRRIGIGSQTEAQKAKKLLLASGISSTVVKIENRMKDGGCLYGIECDGEQIGYIMRALREGGIYATITQ